MSLPRARPRPLPDTRSARHGNTGQVFLRRRSRCVDPMAAFDALPPPLRRWLAAAALPWSPASCLRLWSRLRARGVTEQEALAALAETESRMLLKERRARGWP